MQYSHKKVAWCAFNSKILLIPVTIEKGGISFVTIAFPEIIVQWPLDTGPEIIEPG